MRIVCVIAYACRQQQENVYNKCRNTHVYYCVVYQITTSSPYSFLFTTSLCTNIHPCLLQHHCVPIFFPVYHNITVYQYSSLFVPQHQCVPHMYSFLVPQHHCVPCNTQPCLQQQHHCPHIHPCLQQN